MTRLVRVTLHAGMSETDGEVLREDGYLWLALPDQDKVWWDQGRNKTTELHWYRSLATGFEHLWWDHEVEDAPDGAGEQADAEDAPDGAGEQADEEG